MATFNNTTFAKPSDISDMLTNLQIVVHMEVDASYWQSKILISKNRTLKSDLIKECKRRFPKTMKDWLRKLRQDIDQFRSNYDRTFYQEHFGEIDQSNSLMPLANFSSLTYSGMMGFSAAPEDANIIFNEGIPDSSVLAKPGVVCIDTNTLDDQHAYMNRGTPTAPIWDIWHAEDGIDFILNPSALLNCQCAAALMWAARDGIFNDSPNHSSPINRGFQMDAKDMFLREYEEAKYGPLADDGKSRISKSEGDFTLIQWGIDGGIVLSDSEEEIDEDIEEEVAAW